MLRVNKENEPEFLSEFKRKNSPKTWNDYNKDRIKEKIKENILVLEQNEYCPYCEKRIYENTEGHIEHIKPRDVYPKEFQNYHNLIVSCNEKDSCGSYKGNKYEDKFINPVLDNPDEYFDYNIANGEIIPKESNEESSRYLRAKYTIDSLNLNSYELRNARANLIDILSVYEGENKKYIQFFLDDRHNFPSLIKIYMNI